MRISEARLYITNLKSSFRGFRGVEGVIAGKSEMYKYLSSKKLTFINLEDPIQVEKSGSLKTYTLC
jgi:UDP-N-acetylmuramoyl-tripeptide--D-alanyl-D-alanine ligase